MVEIFKIEKVVNSINELAADQVYLVRNGVGFDIFCTDSSGQIAHRLNSPKRIKTLESEFSTRSNSPQQTGLKLDLQPNKNYIVSLIGAVQSSSYFGGVGLGLNVPNGSVITGNVNIQYNDDSFRNYQQTSPGQIQFTTRLKDNDTDNSFNGRYIVSTGNEAGDVELICRSSTTFYDAKVIAGRTKLIVEEIFE